MIEKGSKVWYTAQGGDRRPAVVVGFGEKNGERVVDVRLEGIADKFERDRWGYVDQISPRSQVQK